MSPEQLQQEANNLKNERKEILHTMADNKIALAEAEKRGDSEQVVKLKEDFQKMKNEAVRIDEEIQKKEKMAVILKKNSGGADGGIANSVEKNNIDEIQGKKNNDNQIDQDNKKRNDELRRLQEEELLRKQEEEKKKRLQQQAMMKQHERGL